MGGGVRRARDPCARAQRRTGGGGPRRFGGRRDVLSKVIERRHAAARHLRAPVVRPQHRDDVLRAQAFGAREQLAGVRIPTLTLLAGKSRMHDTGKAAEHGILVKGGDALEMTRRGPRARLVEFEGVGHAPTLIADNQVEAVVSFLLQETEVPDEKPHLGTG